MRIELSINERTIGNFIVHNTGKTNANQIVYDIYNDTPSEDAEVLSDIRKLGSVTHRRQSGASALTAKVMNEVVEEEHLE